MAAPGGAPAAPTPGLMPATATPSFATHVYNDPTKDADNGNYAQVLAPFVIDPNNVGNSLAPDEIRNRINGRSTAMDPLALGILSEGRIRVYLCPQRLDQPLGQPNHNRWNRFYAFDGDLLGNTSYSVHVRDTIYGLVPNNINVPTVATITAAIGGDPNLQLLGPYADGDAGTEVIRVRRTIVIPFSYVNVFLANEVTPRFFWETIHPQIITDGREADCLALLRFFQVAITQTPNGGPSVLELPALPAAGRDQVIHQARTRILHHHLPGLSTQHQANQQNAIATQLANIATQQQQFRQEDQNAKTLASARTVQTWLGDQAFDKLLRYSHSADEAGLAPIWGQLARAKKADWLSIVQAQYDHYREQLNEEHLTMMADMSLLTTTIHLSWGMATKDSITTGIQPFRFPDTDTEAYEQRNSEIELMLSGSTQTTLADARTISQAKLILPSNESSLRNVRRLQIWALTFLPANHPVQVYLGTHYTDMQSFRSQWDTWKPSMRPELVLARGIYHCKYLATEFSEYWKAQGRVPTPQQLSDAKAISKAIQREQQWEPILTDSFLVQAKVLEYCGLPTPGSRPDNANPGGGPGRGGLGSGGGLNNRTTVPPGANSRLNNVGFNSQLFSSYRTSSVRCAEIRRRIAAGDKPALPLSKVDQQAMCLAWHCKGQCNAACPRAADHVAYTAEEYAPLVAWCTANFNAE